MIIDNINKLTKGSRLKVKVKCNFCDCEKIKPYKEYLKLTEKYNNYCCRDCFIKEKSNERNKSRNKKYISFKNALIFARKLNINTIKNWRELHDNGLISKNIPKYPEL